MVESNFNGEQALLASAYRHLQLASVNGSTSSHSDFAHSHAILIGINDYANGIQRLTTATHDAEALAELLEGQHGYQVQCLTTAVNKAALTELFTQHLPATIQADDRLLVYFAGHGIALDGDDGPAGYLIPQDARPEAPESFLAMRDFHQWLSQLPCRHLLVILDCCFAGAFRWANTRSLKALPDKLYRERFERFIRDPAWQVLTSAAYDQKALDFLTGNSLGERGQQNGHSPFAQALFAALAGKGDLVPAGGDGVITATELYLYLRDYVEVAAEQQAHHRQTPGLWPLQKHDKGEFIFFAPGQEVKLEPAPALTAENNPYRGLASYDYSAKDARLFFGRNSLIDELATLVEQHGLTLVLGASGTGKSSLVKAGLLPKLHPPSEEQREDNAAWRVLTPMRPTDQPLRVLHNLLTHELADGQAVDTFADPPRLAQTLRQTVSDWCVAHPQQRLLLVVDQLEELITLCRNDSERTAFLDLLAALLHSQPDRLHIVLTLRSDFEPQFAQSPLFTQPMQAVVRFTVPPLSQAELREVIEGPAAASTVFFEDSKLVDDLINEVVQMPGALPLLSFTLEQLYLRYLKRQEEGRAQGITIDRSLIRADYKALRGVIGSLNRRASEEYDHLPDDAHRATLRRVMLRMVAVEGGELARRRVALQELEYSNNGENQRVVEVLKRLVDARLLVAGIIDADEYVEPAHDALVRAWDQLYIWQMDAERSLPLALRRELTQAANNWNRADEKDKLGLLWNNNPWLPRLKNEIAADEEEQLDTLDYLLNPSLMFKIHMQVTAKPRLLNRHESTFVKYSVDRRSFLWRRLVSITLGVIIALAGLSLLAESQRRTAVSEADARATEVIVRTTAQADAVAAAATAEVRRIDAERSAAIADSRRLAAQSQAATVDNHPLSLLLAIEAMTVTQNLDPAIHQLRVASAEQALVNALQMPIGFLLGGYSNRVDDVVFSPDERWLTVRVYESQRNTTILYVWDLLNVEKAPQVLFEHINHDNEQVYFTSHKRWVIADSSDGTMTIWDLANVEQAPHVLLKPQNVNGERVNLVFDGHWIIATNNNNTIQLWNLESLEHAPIILPNPKNRIDYLRSSSDDQWLITNHNEETARLWDLKNPHHEKYFPLGEPGEGVAIAAFSEVKNLLAVVGGGKIRLWNLAEMDAKPHILFDNVYGSYPQLSFSPDGKWLAYTGYSSDERWFSESEELGPAEDLFLFDAETLGTPPRLIIDDGNHLTFSTDGQWLLVANKEYTVQLWNLNDLDAKPRNLQGHIDRIITTAFAPDNRKIITASSDATIRVWDVHDPEAVPLLLDGYEGSLDNTILSPTGQWIATKSSSDVARLWSLSDPYGLPHRILRYHEGWVWDLAFSPDGQWLASAGGDVTARLINMKDPAFRHLVLHGHQGQVNSVSFSSDGNWLATGSADGRVRIWDMHNLNEQPRILMSQRNSEVNSVAFSPNNRWLAATNVAGLTMVWSISDLDHGPQLLRSYLGWMFFVDYSPDNHRLATTGQSGAVAHLWNVEHLEKQPLILRSGVADSARAGVFSPDGQWFSTVSQNEVALLWDMNHQHVDPFVLRSHNEGIWNVAFDHSGRWLATASADHTVRLWDVHDLSIEPLVFSGHRDKVLAVAFSPDNEWMASGGADNTIQLWHYDRSRLAQQACRIAGRNLTRAEWEQYFQSSNKYHVTCPLLPPHPTVVDFLIQEGDRLIQAGNWVSASLMFKEAASLDPTLLVEQLVTNGQKKAGQTFIQEGRELSRRGDLDGAVAKFKQALQFDHTLQFDELQAEAQEKVFAWLVEMGVEHADANQIDQAIERFQEALTLVGAMKPQQLEQAMQRLNGWQAEVMRVAFTKDVEIAASVVAVGVLYEHGRDLLRFNKDQSGAIAKFEQAVELAHTLSWVVANELKLIAIEKLLEDATNILSGSDDQRVDTLRAALTLIDSTLTLPAQTWNSLCRWGSLYGFANEVLMACEQAVTLADNNTIADYRDSRALAGALTGNVEGAIEDFEFAITWAKETGYSEEFITTRQGWIDDLKAGKNPFTKEVLRQLREE